MYLKYVKYNFANEARLLSEGCLSVDNESSRSKGDAKKCERYNQLAGQRAGT